MYICYTINKDQSINQSIKSASFTIISSGYPNCRSAAGKIALIHDLINVSKFDVLFLSETWFTSDTPTSLLRDVAPPGYSALHVVRPTGPGLPARGGGLAAVFHHSVPIHAHPLAANYRPSTFELQLLRVGTTGSLLTILNLYQPQWMSTPSTFCDKLTDIIALLTSECTDDTLVCGDANCPGPDDSFVHVELSEGLDSVGLMQLVTQPTRRLPGAASLLDILAASSVSRVTNVTVSEADFISDHCLQLSAALAVRLPKPVVKYTWRNTRNINTTSFEDDLHKSVIFSQPATDDAYVDQLDSVLTELLDKHAPVHTSRRRPPKISRWLSDEAITAKRLRRRLERHWHYWLGC